MKTIEEYFDFVLKTLVDNDDVLCAYEVENVKAYMNNKLELSSSFQKLYADLGLTNKEGTFHVVSIIYYI